MCICLLPSLSEVTRRKELRIQASCFKCRAKREIKNPKAVTLKNGTLSHTGGLPELGHHGIPHRQELAGNGNCQPRIRQLTVAAASTRGFVGLLRWIPLGDM
jgi:hypothetical protein